MQGKGGIKPTHAGFQHMGGVFERPIPGVEQKCICVHEIFRMLVNIVLCTMIILCGCNTETGGQSLRQNRLIKAYFEADDDHKYRTSNMLLGVQLVDCLFSTGFLVHTKFQADTYQATKVSCFIDRHFIHKIPPNEKKCGLQMCAMSIKQGK